MKGKRGQEGSDTDAHPKRHQPATGSLAEPLPVLLTPEQKLIPGNTEHMPPAQKRQRTLFTQSVARAQVDT